MADTETFDIPAVGTDCTECPAPNCTWFGIAAKLAEHLEDAHGAIVCRR